MLWQSRLIIKRTNIRTFRCWLIPRGSLLTGRVAAAVGGAAGGAGAMGGVGALGVVRAPGGVGALGAGVEDLDANSGGGGGVFICSSPSSFSSLSSILHSTRQSSLTIIIFAKSKCKCLHSNHAELLKPTRFNPQTETHSSSWLQASVKASWALALPPVLQPPEKEVSPKSVNSSW